LQAQSIDSSQERRDLVPARENAGHHNFFSTLIRRQVVEEWRRYGSSIESSSVVRDPFREEQLLQPLLVVERRVDPPI
jgi:hypothetical protein